MTLADAIGGYQSADEWGTSGFSSIVGGALGGTDSGFSGALSGAAKGAAIGTMFGPWGTAIGAGVGLLGGAIGGENIANALDNVGTGLSAWGDVGAGIAHSLGFANGLDYVPYDNFPAILHKGETVVNATTAQTLRNNGINGTDKISELPENTTSTTPTVTVSTETIEKLLSTISDLLSGSKDIQSDILSNVLGDPMMISEKDGNKATATT